MLFIGIDPGVTGAIASVCEAGRLVLVSDVPREPTGPKCRPAIDYLTISALAFSYARKSSPGESVWIEHVWGGAGQSGQFQFGEAYGALTSAFVAAGFRVEKVAPVKWKHDLRLPRGKDGERAALEKARALWPNCREMFARDKDHNRADAALIAYWARLKSIQA